MRCLRFQFCLLSCLSLFASCGAEAPQSAQVEVQAEPEAQPETPEPKPTERLDEAPIPEHMDQIAIERIEELERLQNLTNLSPGSFETWLDLGMGYEAAGIRELALVCYDQVHLREAEDPKSWYRSGICNWRMGNLELALKNLTHALRIEPNYAPSYYHKGIIQMDQGDLDAAMQSFTRGAQVNPEYRGSYFGQARVHLQRDEPQAALDLLQSLEEKYPEDTKINNLLVTALRQAGVPSDRVPEEGAYPGDIADPNWGDPWQFEMASFRVRSFKASIRAMLGDLGKAEVALDKMLERNRTDPDDWSYVGLQARALFKLKRLDELKDLYRRYLLVEPNNVSARIQLAYYLEASGVPEQAIPWLDQALRIDPKSKKAWTAKGRMLCGAQQFEAAYLPLQKARELDPGSLEVLFWSLKDLLGLQKWDESLPLFREYVAKNPDNGDVWLDFARARIKIRGFSKAEEALDRAVALNVGRAKLVKHLRTLLERNKAKHPSK